MEELARYITGDGITKKQARRLVKILLDRLGWLLVTKKRVVLPFGTFHLKKMPPITLKNPIVGEKKIPERYRLRFKPGKFVKDNLL